MNRSIGREEITLTLSRGQLYRLVWSRPMSVVAADLGISAPKLSKMCRNLDVPMPISSYWSLSLGRRSPVQASLRPADLTTLQAITFPCGPLPQVLRDLEAFADEPPPLAELIQRFSERLGSIGPSGARIVHRDLKLAFRKTAGGPGRPSGNRQPYRPERPLALLNSLLIGLARAGCTSRALAREFKALVKVGPHPVVIAVDRLPVSQEWSDRPITDALRISVSRPYSTEPPASSWKDAPDYLLEGRLTEVALGIAIAAHRMNQEPSKDISGSSSVADPGSRS